MSDKSKSINALAKSLMRLPGVGPRSARKMAFHLLDNREQVLKSLITNMQSTYDEIKTCQNCGNFDEVDPCASCSDPGQRDILCIVKTHMDLYTIQSSKFAGHYHVLGSNFSPSSSGASQEIEKIRRRIKAEGFSEVILAMHASVEGRMIMHYLEVSLSDLRDQIKLSHPGLGIPVGSDFDTDPETMSFALRNRVAI